MHSSNIYTQHSGGFKSACDVAVRALWGVLLTDIWVGGIVLIVFGHWTLSLNGLVLVKFVIV